MSDARNPVKIGGRAMGACPRCLRRTDYLFAGLMALLIIAVFGTLIVYMLVSAA